MEGNTSGLFCPGCQPGDFPQHHICGQTRYLLPREQVTYVGEGRPSVMRRFHLERDTDVTGISGTGRVAEGVVFSNGKVAMAWLTEVASVGVYDRIDDIERIHGHGGMTRIVWEDA